MAKATEELQTSLESCVFQLSNDVCSFFVRLSYQKLLTFLCSQNSQKWMGKSSPRSTKSGITFKRINLQVNDAHFWNPECCGFPTMSFYELTLSKVISFQRSVQFFNLHSALHVTHFLGSRKFEDADFVTQKDLKYYSAAALRKSQMDY